MSPKAKKHNFIALSFMTLVVIGIFIVLPIWAIFTFEKVMLFKYLGLTNVANFKLIQGFAGSLIVGWLAVYIQEWWLSKSAINGSHGAWASISRIVLTYPFFVIYVYFIWCRLDWGQNLGLILASAAVITIGWYLSRFPEFIVKKRIHM